MLTKKFIERLKLSSKPHYQIAHEAEIHPSMVSQIINGIVKVEKGDQRVIRIGKIIGLSETECFE